MSRHIFLYPIFDRKTLTQEETKNGDIVKWSAMRPKEILYQTYNFWTVEDVVISNIKPELYVFCRSQFVSFFQQLIRFSTATTTNIIADVSMVIRVVGAEYDVVTNAGPLSFLSTFRIDDHVMPSTLFIFQTETYALLNDLHYKLKNIQALTPVFNVLMPQTLEMSFFLKKIFEVGKAGSILDDKKIMNAQATNKCITSTAVTHLYNPTDTFNCFVDMETNRVGAFSCQPDAAVTKKFLYSIPRINIAAIFKYPSAGFHPTNEIVAIIISLYTCDLHSMIVLLNLSNTANAQALNGYHPSLSMYMYVCDSESLLLKRFIQLYVSGDIFENIKLATRQLHWLLYNKSRKGGSMEAIYDIMDRIFFNDKMTKILSLCKHQNNMIFLNGNAMLYDIEGLENDQPTYNNSSPTLFDYIRDVHNPPSIKIDIDSNHVTVHNKVITDFRADVAHLYINILNIDVPLQTPIALIKNYASHFHKLYASFNIEYLYEASNALKIAISNLDAVSKSEQSRLYLFFHYMKHGVILLPTNNASASRTILDGKPLDIYNIRHGGHVYSTPGLFKYFVACIDFNSFYPSIYSAFHLSFDNVAIILGRDLIRVFEKHCIFLEYVQSFGILFHMDDTYAKISKADDIIVDRRYVLIIKSQCQHGVSIGGLCKEFINRRLVSTGAKIDVQKNLINILCGCIGSDSFPLQSNDLYNVNTFLGRRIILFSCSKIMLDDNSNRTVEDVAKLFFEYNATIHQQSEKIINIDTDGFCVILKGEEDANAVCSLISKVYNQVIMMFEDMLKISTETARNVIQCKISFCTNFIINCERKRYFYIKEDGGGQPSVYGTKVDSRIRNLVLKMYNDDEVDKVNHQSADTNFLFHSYYIYKRKTRPDINLEILRELVERRGGFTFKTATNMFGYCDRGTDFSFLYSKRPTIPSTVKNIHLRDLLQKYLDYN